MKLTNNQIYIFANALIKEFNNDTQQLPIKANFYLVKNKNVLIGLAQEIDQSRNALLEKYGEISEDKTIYNIPKENSEIVYKEMEDLFQLTQEVDIYKISLKDLGDSALTISQMEALMFMIEEE